MLALKQARRLGHGLGIERIGVVQRVSPLERRHDAAAKDAVMIDLGHRLPTRVKVGPDFHARWQAVSKIYHYRIFRGRIVSPFEWRYALHDPYPLDTEAMAQAARLFEGEHDFTSFAASSGSKEDDRERTAVRVIHRSETVVDPQRQTLTYVVRGRSFLSYMVRKMVGTMLAVCRGKLTPE